MDLHLFFPGINPYTLTTNGGPYRTPHLMRMLICLRAIVLFAGCNSGDVDNSKVKFIDQFEGKTLETTETIITTTNSAPTLEAGP